MLILLAHPLTTINLKSLTAEQENSCEAAEISSSRWAVTELKIQNPAWRHQLFWNCVKCRAVVDNLLGLFHDIIKLLFLVWVLQYS